MELFRVRLNCIDSYQAMPNPFDPPLRRNISSSERYKEPDVPVIRVFGSTETGQKVCAHIHGAFPYLYIEYTGSLVPDEVGAYIHRLRLSIDHAMAVSFRRNTYDGKAKYVARITVVKGIPFYGYHVGYQFYLKIYLLNPSRMTRLADLLRQGAIMKKAFQPYEAHIQFLLQWMMDYNMYGCHYIDCGKVNFRSPVPRYEDMDSIAHLWHDRSIPKECITKADELPRVSHCSIEIDVCVQDILNRKEIKPRPLHHDFIERLDPLAPDEKLVHSMAGLWRDETRRRKAQMGLSDPTSSPFPPEVMVSMSAGVRNSQPGGWIHEEEYMEKVKSIILEEKNQSDSAKISFGNFIKRTPFEGTVQTAFESVTELYPGNLEPLLGLMPQDPVNAKADGVEVDEKRIFVSKYEENDEWPYDEDENIMREEGAEDLPVQKRKDETEDEYPSGQAFQDQISESKNRGTGSTNDEATGSQEESLENPISSEGSLIGICPSRAKDFQQPEIPLLREFIPTFPKDGDTFTDEGLSSEHIFGVKRGREVTPQETRFVKRQKIEDLKPGRKTRGASHPPDLLMAHSESKEKLNSTVRLTKDIDSVPTSVLEANALNRIRAKSENQIAKQLPPMTLSQESIKAGLSSKHLGFPVVKDPHEHSISLRISQQNESQKSYGSSPPKSQRFANFPMTLSQVSEKSIHSSTPQEGVCTTRMIEIARAISKINVGGESSRTSVFGMEPPSALDVASSMRDFNLPDEIHQNAYYSRESDVPERAREWAGREFKLESLTVPFLPDFDSTGTSAATFGEKSSIIPDKANEEKIHRVRRRNCTIKNWELEAPPPTYEEVEAWALDNPYKNQVVTAKISNSQNESEEHAGRLSQIEGPTQKGKHGFKFSQKQNSTSVQHQNYYMSTMALEIHVNTRGKFVPNPEEDEVQCVFWCLESDEESVESNGIREGTHIGIVALSEDGIMTERINKETRFEVVEETSELDLLIRIVEIVRTHDPDILTGYEVHTGSWGYLIERARLKYDYNLTDEFSRMMSQSHGRFGKESDKWGFNTTSTIKVTGRHVINIWRAMRSELNLLQYTMENVAFHLLHRRIPHFAFIDLTIWYTNNKPGDLAKLLNYYILRVQLDLEILEQNELTPRTSEQARLLGVDFFSVFSRGSQYKVESLMFRIAKPENFMLVSPSRGQVGGQNALECLPLVMEPQSNFYSSPLLVLDFQSLYPSVMIAYNYCYSTFLGRVVDWRGQNKMGFANFQRQQRLLELVKDHITISPNGMMYVKPDIRKSLLAKMLGEILETRVMVKDGMKKDKDDKTLQRLLNNRQLALKLIANVTYGYTSASFSGRMPCAEIADSIVQTGRETLERAIALIHSVEKWGAEVVYGDTDSLFVHLKGRTKNQAFEIGDEIAKTITNMNPRPIKLKFEKVYFPCVLLAKKRYVGFKYEHKDQVEPNFDAKGIETVRRDGTPAEQKIEEKALKILFRTKDLSQVKDYFQKQCEKIMKGKVSVQDFCFAKEVKLGTYSDKGPPPPGAMISTKRMLEDPRAEPQYGERVPYAVITGAPGARLIDRCVAPETLLTSEHNELDAEYYISKNLIPPLERIFNLVGANVRGWYDEMPKVQRIRRVDTNPLTFGQGKGSDNLTVVSKKTLESYMKSSLCLVCREKLDSENEGGVCETCLSDRATSLLSLRTRLNAAEKTDADLQRVCRSCSGLHWRDEVRCDSKDCGVFYTRTRQRARLVRDKGALEPVMKLLEEVGRDERDLEW